MSDPSYIHLRLHTEYSISDGILRIKDLCKAAAEDEMPAIAITDLSNLFGMVKFFKEARKRRLWGRRLWGLSMEGGTFTPRPPPHVIWLVLSSTDHTDL